MTTDGWRSRLGGAVFLAALALPATAAPATDPLARRFKSFDVACSNLAGFCAASAKGVGAGKDLAVGRAMERQAGWWVAIALPPGWVDPAAALSIAVDDGAPLDFEPGRGWLFAGFPGQAVLTDAGKVDLLLAAMAKGDRLTLKTRWPNGEDLTEAFPLDGLVASILWIDERQKRPDAPRKAGAHSFRAIAPGETERAVSLDAQDVEPPEAVRRAYGTTDCRTLDEGEKHAFSVMELDAATVLYVMRCDLWSGQSESIAILEQSGKAAPLPLPVWKKGRIVPGPARLHEADIERRFRQLTASEKFDRNGWCGSSQVWRWDGRGFRLIQATEQRKCPAGDGDEEREEGVFPVVFQEKPERR